MFLLRKANQRLPFSHCNYLFSGSSPKAVFAFFVRAPLLTYTFSVVGPSFFFLLSFVSLYPPYLPPPHSMQPTNKGHEPSSPQQQDSKHRRSIKQSTVAESLLSDTLFPPRKPKPATMIYDDTFDSDNEQSEDSDKDPVKKDPLATQVWRMYTKAKDNLPNGSRLENLTWRMMAMTLKKKEREAAAAAASAASSPQSDVIDDRIRHTSQPPSTTYKSSTDDYYHPMALDNDVAAKKDKNTMQQSEALVQSQYRGATGTDPPESDDTTALLSSSAPPYMFDFLNSNPALTNRTATQPDSGASNTLVSGSTRALLPGKSTGAMSNRGGLHQHTVSCLSHPEYAPPRFESLHL